jgi:putative multicomponent Na+:H+ antiporter subunit B
MTDSYLYIITALLPLAALMLLVQTNPYTALVLRALLGAIAALVYAMFGAADVALTEALVGTLLSIALYLIAIRSSLVLQLGILEAETEFSESALFNALQTLFRQQHLRLEIIPYPEVAALQQALQDQEVHAICVPGAALLSGADLSARPEALIGSHATITRIQRLYELMQAGMPSSLTQVTLRKLPALPTSSGQER